MVLFEYAEGITPEYGLGTVKLLAICVEEEVQRSSASCLPLSLAAFLSRFTHTRMPIFVLSMRVAEPSFTRGAVHCCRIATRLIKTYSRSK